MLRFNMNRLFKFKSTIVPLFKNFSEKVKFKFVYLSDNKEVDAEAYLGDHVLKVAKEYNIDLEGVCDASLACLLNLSCNIGRKNI